MRTALFLAMVMFALSVCDRRPVQKDLPVKNAPQNSVDHSGRHVCTIQSSPNAASAPYELQFIDTMIAHHEGAVDISQLVQTRSGHAELRSVAADIIREQQKEIATLRSLRGRYFKDASSAINMELPGMQAGIDGMDADRLDPLKENAFDREFIGQMIPHHEAAIEMSRALLSRPAGQPAELSNELRLLAQSVADSQETEVSRMKEWQKAWSKQP
jgi:uncharacterized protein (DUF305 family)